MSTVFASETIGAIFVAGNQNIDIWRGQILIFSYLLIRNQQVGGLSPLTSTTGMTVSCSMNSRQNSSSLISVQLHVRDVSPFNANDDKAAYHD